MKMTKAHLLLHMSVASAITHTHKALGIVSSRTGSMEGLLRLVLKTSKLMTMVEGQRLKLMIR